MEVSSESICEEQPRVENVLCESHVVDVEHNVPNDVDDEDQQRSKVVQVPGEATRTTPRPDTCTTRAANPVNDETALVIDVLDEPSCSSLLIESSQFLKHVPRRRYEQRGRKRVSIINLPGNDNIQDMMYTSHVTRHVTKDIHGRFKNKRSKSLVPRKHSVQFDSTLVDLDGEEGGGLVDFQQVITGGRRRSSTIIGSPHITGSTKKQRRSQSGTSNLLRGGCSRALQNSKKNSLARSSLTRSSLARSSMSSSSSKEKFVGNVVYLPSGKAVTRNKTNDANRRRSTPVDLVDFSDQYGNPNSLMFVAFLFMISGMVTLLVAFYIHDKAKSHKTGIIGCCLLIVGGILMVFGLCWYYVKSKCLFSDDDLKQLKSGMKISKLLGARLSTF